LKAITHMRLTILAMTARKHAGSGDTPIFAHCSTGIYRDVLISIKKTPPMV
jgi:hypothetical protein